MFSDGEIAEEYAESVEEHQPASMAVALQSFGRLDFSGQSKSGKGVVGIERRTSAVAGDGFLFDDEPGRTGRLPREAAQLFRAAVARLMSKGLSLRAISRATGLSINTVRAWRREMPVAHVCLCGQEASHQGWCSERFKRSRPRQEFMRMWHRDGKWELVTQDTVAMAWDEKHSQGGER